MRLACDAGTKRGLGRENMHGGEIREIRFILSPVPLLFPSKQRVSFIFLSIPLRQTWLFSQPLISIAHNDS